MENIERNKKLREILFPLGFESTSLAHSVFTHKMYNHTFDFSKTDTDVYWVMDTIFKTCEQWGQFKKAYEIRSALNIIE